MKLAELGEFGLIERIRAAAPGHPGLRLGIGDDCAVNTLAADEELLTTTDLLLEGIHFRRDWTDLRRLGRKCISVNVSDIAAMGGEVRALYLGLGLPADLGSEALDELLAGVIEAAADYGAALAGGDTCRSPGPLLLAVTAEGAVASGGAVRRSGARPGEDLFVTGSLGDSALALRELMAGRQPSSYLASRHFDPSARASLGRALAAAGIATAMIDLSDGLLADLGHLLAASRCGAELESSALPLSPDFAAALAGEPELLQLALSGGEDYELLFAAPSARSSDIRELAATQEIAIHRIGQLTAPEHGLIVKDRSGCPLPLRHGGYDHFR